MTDIYEGDPKMILGPNGSRFEYKGGQPVMDRGIENSVFIDLGTRSKGVDSHQNGWVGNLLQRDPALRIGSDYIETIENVPITLAGLSIGEQAAKIALSGPIYGKVSSEMSNPALDTKLNKIVVNAPEGVLKVTTKFSQLWQFQATDPANERI